MLINLPFEFRHNVYQMAHMYTNRTIARNMDLSRNCNWSVKINLSVTNRNAVTTNSSVETYNVKSKHIDHTSY